MIDLLFALGELQEHQLNEVADTHLLKWPIYEWTDKLVDIKKAINV